MAQETEDFEKFTDAQAASHAGPGLRRGSLSARHIAFFVIAAAAPLTCVVALTPISIAFGAGDGATLTYLIAGAILALFAVGFVAMSRHVPRAGAFYAYISSGLSRPVGMGAAFVSVATYLFGVLALSAFAGFALSGSINFWLRVDIPWFWCSAAILLLTTAMSIFEISLGARVLGTLMILEMLLLLLLGAAILLQGGASGISFEPFSPSTLTQGGVGVSLIFAYASFIGFEQTAIYSEEARDSRRSVPRATYLAVGVITVFYVFVSWTLLLAYGVKVAPAAAAKNPAEFVSIATDTYLGGIWNDLLSILIVTSSFAAVLAFHNASARYLFSMGRERLLPRQLGRVHSRFRSPWPAAVVVGAINILALGVLALNGVDPYLKINAWASAAAAVGVILLQTVCSIAVIVFFRRTRLERRLWQSVIAPVLGCAGLSATLYLVIENFGLLTGSTSDTDGPLMLGAFVLLGAGGAVYGLIAKRVLPDRYEAFASEIAPVEPTQP